MQEYKGKKGKLFLISFRMELKLAAATRPSHIILLTKKNDATPANKHARKRTIKTTTHDPFVWSKWAVVGRVTRFTVSFHEEAKKNARNSGVKEKQRRPAGCIDFRFVCYFAGRIAGEISLAPSRQNHFIEFTR